MIKKIISIGVCIFMPISSWGAITHIGSVAATGASGTATVTRAAGGTSNLYIVHCVTSDITSTLTMSNTPNAFVWTRTSSSTPIKVNTSTLDSFWAIPNTTVSQSIVCTRSGTGSFTNLNLDEFSGTNTVSPIDVSSATVNTVSACSTTGTMSVNNEAMWSGIDDSITNVGNINSTIALKGSDDLSGDWTEYRINSGTGSGSTIVAAFTGTASGAMCVTAGIKPAVAATSVACPSMGLLGVGCQM